MAEPLPITRRDVLRSIAVAAGMPALARAATGRRSVGVIGGGMAGVSLAWLLDGQRDVVLLEARSSIPRTWTRSYRNLHDVKRRARRVRREFT